MTIETQTLSGLVLAEAGRLVDRLWPDERPFGIENQQIFALLILHKLLDRIEALEKDRK